MLAAGAVMARRVGPCDIGRKVSIRRLDPDGALRDAVGILLAFDDDVTVVRRTGENVTFEADTIVASRVVAPEIGAEGLQQIVQAAMPSTRMARLGDWELRFSPTGTRRSCSVRVTGDPGVPLAEALAAVIAWYTALEAPALLQLPVPSRWSDALVQAGWTFADDPCEVMTAPARGLSSQVADGFTAAWSASAPACWAEVAGHAPLAGERQAHLMLVDAQGPAAWSRSVIEGRWQLLTSLGVAPRARRLGLARQMVAMHASRGLERGAEQVALHMLSSNDPARALYESLGFTRHHIYTYVEAPRGDV